MWSKHNCLQVGHRLCAFQSPPHCSLFPPLLFTGTCTWKGMKFRFGISRALFLCLTLYNEVIKQKDSILGNGIWNYWKAHLGSIFQCSFLRHHKPQACNPLFRDLNVNIIVFATEFNSHEDAVLHGWSEHPIGLFLFPQTIEDFFWRIILAKVV